MVPSQEYTRAYANGPLCAYRNWFLMDQTMLPQTKSKKVLDCRDYERAYMEGHTGKDVEQVIKVYKSHRRVSI